MYINISMLYGLTNRITFEDNELTIIKILLIGVMIINNNNDKRIEK